MQYSESEHKRLARAYRFKKYGVAYLFLSPNLLFFFIFLVIPFFWVLWLTFNSGGILTPTKFVGLQNWSRVLQDPTAWRSLLNTLYYMAIAIPTVFAIGMGLALLLKRTTKFVTPIRAMIYFPTLAPIVVGALLWIFVVHPDFGLFNTMLRLLGLPIVNWLGNPATALPTIASLEVWRGSGYWTVLFLAALLALPTELFDAAKIDGAGAIRRFWHLTLPLLRPTWLFAIVMATIWNFQLFDSVYILTDGGPNYSTATAVWYIYKNTFQFDKPGYGAAMSFFLLIITLVLAVVELRLMRKKA
ncbi:MAG: sugar ABC transporter permease [Chloroflexi bacterium]|nr:sugar ABC transporter permease [Chloroflexota bacterium]